VYSTSARNGSIYHQGGHVTVLRQRNQHVREEGESTGSVPEPSRHTPRDRCAARSWNPGGFTTLLARTPPLRP
jgi:hypothetical protein